MNKEKFLNQRAIVDWLRDNKVTKCPPAKFHKGANYLIGKMHRHRGKDSTGFAIRRIKHIESLKKMELVSKGLEQNGVCNTCGRIQEDKYYIFCNSRCQRIWWMMKEYKAGKFDVTDKEYYKRWLEERTQTIQSMNNEQLENRVVEIIHIEFYAERESQLIHEQWDRNNGRKGIPPWLKAERSKLITDPNIDVNFDGEPRKKTVKKERTKTDYSSLLDDVTQIALDRKKAAKLNDLKVTEADVTPKPKSSNEVNSLDILLATPKPKMSKEEILAKAEAMKEKLKLGIQK